MPATLNGWLKILALVVPLALAGLVAGVVMRAELTSVQRELDTKAERSVVETNQRNIIARLDRLFDQVERLTERPVTGRIR